MNSYLKDRSIEIILKNQHPSGSYIACPNFDTYKYCWLRDGSFIAYSMDICGQHGSAESFFSWVDRVIGRYGEKVREIIKTASKGEPLLNSDFLPTRYMLDGSETRDEWPNFQLDGYGTWLWALTEHMEMTGASDLLEKYSTSIHITIDYLAQFFSIPNFDCWEENGDKVHTSTLACLFGGLESISRYDGFEKAGRTAELIRKYVLDNCIYSGKLVKYIGTGSIDASLLWAALPFRLFGADCEIMKDTVAAVEKELLHGGGVHRYSRDTYYGGGEWILLSCWLGWYYAEIGEAGKAGSIAAWVENQAGADGELPEQVLVHVNDPKYIEEWRSLWGDAAKPLLWSHAMYLILQNKLEG